MWRMPNFYPRPPRGGRRVTPSLFIPDAYFYPRPPRGGRRNGGGCFPSWCYFYPRPPRGGRPILDCAIRYYTQISIHALREEGDAATLGFAAAFFLFLSTPSARRATTVSFIFVPLLFDFYPRPPRGGRLEQMGEVLRHFRFLSTPSARRAT